MQTKLILALACCFPFPAAAQVTITGTWKADDVAFPPWTFVLKADGNNLSGAVSQGRSDPASSMVTTLVQAVEITEGAIDGNRLSFRVNALNGNTIAFSGVVNGDTIAFTRELVSESSGLNGIFGAKGASSFTAKFASTSTEIQAPQAPAVLRLATLPIRASDRYLRVAISRKLTEKRLSVTEGEDKPLKYPTIFNGADVAAISKIDLADAVEFDGALACCNIGQVRPGMQIVSVSAKTGQGMDAWLGLLESRARRAHAAPI
jgi:hypothetical protein